MTQQNSNARASRLSCAALLLLAILPAMFLSTVSTAGAPALDAKFLGTYRSNLCPDNCYWTIKPDGSGTWSSGIGFGAHARAVPVPIRWEMIEPVERNGESGYMLRVTYLEAVPDDVKAGLTHDAKTRNDNHLRVYGSSTDSRCCYAQFYGQLNAFYNME